MIRLKNISKYYSKNQTVSLGLRKINLELGLNEFVAIVGESGSGKTTLLNVISGIDSYEEGEMYINDEETSYFSSADWENYRKKYIAFIFQNYNLIESYTVLQNVEAALILSGYPKEKLRHRATEIIERVGLKPHMHHRATKLSGGQKQRVVIARAIAKDAPVIVADEPTGNLDSESAKSIIDLLAEIAKDKLVIIVTHDFSQVESRATRRIRIYDGEIVEDKRLVKTDVTNLPTLEDKDYHMSIFETIKMVLRNLIATPKKSILLMIIFLFSTFFFAFIYGSFSNAQSESVYYSDGYKPSTRILVNKLDGTPFSDEEILELENNPRVDHMINYDFLLDIEAFVRVVNDGRRFGYSAVMLPISLLNDDTISLEKGEVAIVFDELYDIFELNSYDELIGHDVEFNASYDLEEVQFELKYYFDSTEVADQITDLPLQVIFLSDEDWETIGIDFWLMEYLSISFYIEETQSQYTFQNILVDEELEKNEMIIPDGYIDDILVGDTIAKINLKDLYRNVEMDDVHFGEIGYSTYISKLLLDELIDDGPYQLSIIANDKIDAMNLYDQLSESEDLYVFYPYGVESNNQLTGLIFLVMNMGFFIVFGLLFLVIFFISYVVIKNIINSKLTDYAIFRTIGANRSTIRSFIYLETMVIAFIAYVIFVIFIKIGSPYWSPLSFMYVLKFFTFKTLVYFLLFILAYSLLLSRRYLTRVYHDTVAQTLKGEVE